MHRLKDKQKTWAAVAEVEVEAVEVEVGVKFFYHQSTSSSSYFSTTRQCKYGCMSSFICESKARLEYVVPDTLSARHQRSTNRIVRGLTNSWISSLMTRWRWKWQPRMKQREEGTWVWHSPLPWEVSRVNIYWPRANTTQRWQCYPNTVFGVMRLELGQIPPAIHLSFIAYFMNNLFGTQWDLCMAVKEQRAWVRMWHHRPMIFSSICKFCYSSPSQIVTSDL